MKRPNVIAKECLAPYSTETQVLQWDKSDIVFTEGDRKQGIFVKVGPDMLVEFSKAKRMNRFRQVVIQQNDPPGEKLTKLQNVLAIDLHNTHSYVVTALFTCSEQY